MKVFKAKILDGRNKFFLSDDEKRMPFSLKDKELQEAFNKYIRLKKTEEYLNAQQELYSDIVFFSRTWQDICKSLVISKKLVDNYAISLNEFYKNFSRLKDADSLSVDDKCKKDYFIKLLTSYEQELIIYDILIKKAERVKQFELPFENTK